MNRFEQQTTTPAGLLASWRWIRDMDLRPVLGLDSVPNAGRAPHR